MKATSKILISAGNIKKNIKYLKNRIGNNVRFASVVKGNAYGHGIDIFLPIVEGCGVNYFAVFDAYEAQEALNVKSESSHLMIMGMIDNEEIEWAVENDISFFVFEMDRLNSAIEAAKIVGKPARIHIELETGLNRTGFEEYDLEFVTDKILKNCDDIILEGICTHYAGAESIANYYRVDQQRVLFHKLYNKLKSNNIIPKYRHTACSAAALTYPETIMDMVRFGIAHYGFWPSPETRMYNLLTEDKKNYSDPLHQAITWKSTVMSLKNVRAGQFVSYGTSFMAQKNILVASVPVGYAHGYSRNLSNLGHVLINGRKAQVVGMVNMNMLLVDVTHNPAVKKGDEVILIGKQGKQHISVTSFSELSNYVNYELLTRLPKDIPREIVK